MIIFFGIIKPERAKLVPWLARIVVEGGGGGGIWTQVKQAPIA